MAIWSQALEAAEPSSDVRVIAELSASLQDPNRVSNNQVQDTVQPDVRQSVSKVEKLHGKG